MEDAVGFVRSVEDRGGFMEGWQAENEFARLLKDIPDPAKRAYLFRRLARQPFSQVKIRPIFMANGTDIEKVVQSYSRQKTGFHTLGILGCSSYIKGQPSLKIADQFVALTECRYDSYGYLLSGSGYGRNYREEPLIRNAKEITYNSREHKLISDRLRVLISQCAGFYVTLGENLYCPHYKSVKKSEATKKDPSNLIKFSYAWKNGEKDSGFDDISSGELLSNEDHDNSQMSFQVNPTFAAQCYPVYEKQTIEGIHYVGGFVSLKDCFTEQDIEEAIAFTNESFKKSWAANSDHKFHSSAYLNVFAKRLESNIAGSDNRIRKAHSVFVSATENILTIDEMWRGIRKIE